MLPKDVLGWSALLVVSAALLGLGAGLDIGKALARPFPWRPLLRALVVAILLVPLSAVTAGWAFGLAGPTLAGLLLIAVSPGAPLAIRRSHAAGSDAAFSLFLQVSVAIAAFGAVPGWIALLSRAYAARVSIDVASVAEQIAEIQLLPLGLGLVLATTAPALARRMAPVLSAVSGACVVLLVAAILAKTWRELLSIPPGAAVASLGVSLVALALGHAAGGPRWADRRASAIVCALRNPGIALLIASLNGLPAETRTMVLAHVLLCAVAVSVYVAVTRPRGDRAKPRLP